MAKPLNAPSVPQNHIIGSGGQDLLPFPASVFDLKQFLCPALSSLHFASALALSALKFEWVPVRATAKPSV